MKIYFSLLVLFIAGSLTSTNAQVYERKTVHSGESLSAISYYLFPSYEDAAVIFKNGKSGRSKMNFNLLLCQMRYINSHGDTLYIAEPADIESITFDSTSFFFDEGYYQIVAMTDSVKLAVLRKVSFSPVKIGAFGLQNRIGNGIQSYSSFLVPGIGVTEMKVAEDLDINTEITCFLIDANGSRLKASKAVFMQLFSKYRNQIKTYLKENKTNFNKENDLERLFNFCAEQ